MRYFSQLKGRRVITNENKPLGKLQDLLFLAADTSFITKLIVETPQKQTIIIPISFLMQINGNIIIDHEYKPEKLAENELFVIKNLLDKQIIDVKGSKVVRVNDVAIQDKDGKSFYISGVDIGIRGILRWFNLGKPALPLYRLFHVESHPHFLSWADIQPLELTRGNVQLKKELGNLEKMHPEDLADYLEKTNIKNVNKIVSNLEEDYAADVIEDLNINYQTALFRRFPPEKAAKLVELIDPDDAVDILLTLTDEKREEILEDISIEKRKKLQKLLKLSKTPIGELLTTEFLTANPEDTVTAVLENIKKQINDSMFAFYIYIINHESHLVGVVGLDQLISHQTSEVISNIMEQDMSVVHLTTPLQIAIKRMLKYKLYALPVIENNKQMLGVVTFDDMTEDILEEL